MKRTNHKPTVFAYGNLVLVRRKDGVDVCSPETGAWSHFATERQAKWSATVYDNLCKKFRATQQDRDALKAQVERVARSLERAGVPLTT